MGEIKPQMPRRDQRSGLLHVLAQHLTQPGMQQMRRRVIAHGRLANLGIHDRVDPVPNFEGGPPYVLFVGWRFLLGPHQNLMRPHALNWVVTTLHFRDDGIVIVGIKPSTIANLPARLCIKRRVIKNDLSRFASLEFLHAQPVVNDCQNLAAVRPRLPITLKLRLGQ